jgi:hypothetical protein
MNQDEITVLCAGKMLKSGKVQIKTNGINIPKQFSNVKLHPNPVQINSLATNQQYHYSIYDIAGHIVQPGMIYFVNKLYISLLSAAKYILNLNEIKTNDQITFSFSKNNI